MDGIKEEFISVATTISDRNQNCSQIVDVSTTSHATLYRLCRRGISGP